MITAVSFPLEGLGFPPCGRLGEVTLIDGPAGWQWAAGEPRLPIDTCRPRSHARKMPDWRIDHVVLSATDLDSTLAELAMAGGDVRRIGETRHGLRAGFVLAGLLVEVVEGSDDALTGLALETDLPLEGVAARWLDGGLDVRGPHPAVQMGRRILSVGRVAVMTRR